MRVLVYNWGRYDAMPELAGGISIACGTAIETLLGAGFEVTFLYSGADYAVLPRAPHIRRATSRLHPSVTVFSFCNSPVPAPALFSSDLPTLEVHQPELEACFARFLADTGPYDAIHFHTLEGLTAGALQVARQAGARVIYTAHNHHAVCPEVNLRKNRAGLCHDFANGRDCVECIGSRKKARAIEIAWKKWSKIWRPATGGAEAMRSLLRTSAQLGRVAPRLTRFLRTHLFVPPNTVDKKPSEHLASQYVERRRAFVTALNTFADTIVCVSPLVRDNLVHYGIRRDRTVVVGHGALPYPAPVGNPQLPTAEGDLRLVYLGKLMEEKGVQLFIEQLLKLPTALQARIDVLFAGPALPSFSSDPRVAQLRRAVKRFTHVWRYLPADLPELLRGRHLGVVPSLCFDCWPMVALEMISCRVPVLVSDRCGAKALLGDPAFVFSPDAADSLAHKLEALLTHQDLLARFWEQVKPIPSAQACGRLLLQVFIDGKTSAQLAKSR